jgi:methanogenic corrinoid protein MtbC1
VSAGPPLAIAAVERDTGLSKDTLRIWERRYGFPQPERDALGERYYPPEQVDKLRLLKRLLDGGHRPGKLVALPMEDLQRLGQGDADAGRRGPDVLAPYRAALAAHDVAGLRRMLRQNLLALGLEAFVVGHVAQLNKAIGEAWMQGELSVVQEHIYTESVQLVLRQAIATLAEPAPDAPRILLATLPQEEHGIGLLMVEALLGLHGCRCMALGVRVPMDGIVDAVALTQADAVGLSFTGSFNAAQAAAGLRELRRLLPASTAIWAGGSCLALQRRLAPGIQAVPDIGMVPGLLKRLRHPDDAPRP